MTVKSHLGSVVLLGFSNSLRHIGYYAFRSILVFYLLKSGLFGSDVEAIGIYSLFIGSFTFSKIYRRCAG